MIYSLLTAAVILILFVLLMLVKRAHGEKAVTVWEKAFAMILLALVLVKGFLQDGFVTSIFAWDDFPTYFDKPYDLAETLSRWLLVFSEALVIAAAFVDSKAIRRVLIRFSLPLSVVALIFLKASVSYITQDFGDDVGHYGFRFPEIVRIAMCIAERAIVIVTALSFAFLSHRGEYCTKTVKRSAVKHLLFGIVCSMPFYTLGTIFGVTDKIIYIGDPLQLLWVAVIFLGFLAIYFGYRNEKLDERRAFMAFLTVVLVIHYSAIYLHGFRMNRLPLQLCNLASYLLLLLLFVKKQGLFNFILVANCPGCVIAIATVTEDSPIFSFWGMHYFVQHTLVFLIPLLLVSLGVFRMPKPKRAIRDYFLGFNVFFLFCLIFGAYETGVLATAENLNHEIFNTGNYFYLLECPVTALSGLYNALSFGKITLFGVDYYVGYLVFIYLVFSILSIGEYYLNYFISKKFGKKNREIAV